jgi:hypothetical protein
MTCWWLNLRLVLLGSDRSERFIEREKGDDESRGVMERERESGEREGD